MHTFVGYYFIFLTNGGDVLQLPYSGRGAILFATCDSLSTCITFSMYSLVWWLQAGMLTNFHTHASHLTVKSRLQSF